MSVTNEAFLGALRALLPADRIVEVSTVGPTLAARLRADRATPPPQLDALAAAARDAVARLPGAQGRPFTIEFVDERGRAFHASGAPQPGHRPIPGLGAGSALPGVKCAIAVGAGKGGVGKSTVAVNLAVGLARRGHAVGLLDADIYGPSLPTMLGLAGLEQSVREGYLQPHYVHGVKAITIGKLVDPEKPLIWRGPMAHGAFKQLVEQTQWGDLDYLVIDLPPGTGDVSLTMAQLLKVTGAVVVCTPQRVAQDDAIRAARMFQQLGIEVLGVVENMSYFVGDDAKVYDLFGRGGARGLAQRLNLPFLGEIPITTSLRISSDEGRPGDNFSPAGSAIAQALDTLVTNVEAQISASRARSTTPTLNIR